MKIFLALICFVFSSLSVSGQLPALDLMSSRTSLKIPFEYYQNFILININLEETLPTKLIFDTGAKNTILFDRTLTNALHLEYAQRVTLQGVDQSQRLEASICRRVGLEFPTLGTSYMDIIVLDDDIFNLSESIGRNIHGILGANFFKGLVVKINYRRKYIEIIRPEDFNKPSNNWSRSKMKILDDKPHLICPTIVDDTTKIDLLYLLDTGSGLSALLHNNTHPGIVLPEDHIPGFLGNGLGGTVDGYLAKIQSIDIMNFRMTNLVLGFQKLITPGLDSVTYSRNGLIGNPILRKFNLIIDYPNEMVYLRPNRFFKNKLAVDRSGLRLYAVGNNHNKLIVKHVLERSPAQKAGILVGDEILKYKMWPVKWYGLSGILRLLQKKAGKTIRLTILRNGERSELVFNLEDLL